MVAPAARCGIKAGTGGTPIVFNKSNHEEYIPFLLGLCWYSFLFLSRFNPHWFIMINFLEILFSSARLRVLLTELSGNAIGLPTCDWFQISVPKHRMVVAIVFGISVDYFDFTCRRNIWSYHSEPGLSRSPDK